MEVSKYVVKFNKPFSFEEKEYTEINLEMIEELTGADVLEAERYATRQNLGMSVGAESSADYAIFVAARAASLPIEFFFKLPAKDAMKVRRAVRVFLYN